ncbi:helix-turn-helix domain-containing protein [Planotetraspora sp. A-T 1434]|uniref:DNA-3-methyladenine glycosylase 2 family protein n=1 Tax=Planotetraspora sp. A-T 1434 TaxID=2979219 RepID=UPI0021BF3CE8|nr:Ada metal-binding domain-containing protein [Planotetraspora sp. A-T 1434]MCT9928769.1 helix-turn-helix domain-containing protein [Planotetraspora sp. A-T 1434]
MTTRRLDFDACYLAVSARDARFDGRFYTAVTSTGIYCRPICPARTPARKNVLFYQHAAAAEAAGFRPCRRCRPELSPGDPGWDVRADLIGRGLRLIDDGVADDHGVAGLAQRLHVTERHLHRLFIAELGTGPLAVARTRRLLLAKQLLTETSLPITDVAFAAGFGSVRQFNAAMKESYGFAPGELRKTVGPLTSGTGQTTGSTTGSATGLTLRLSYRRPYDAQTILRFLAARAIPAVEAITWSSQPDPEANRTREPEITGYTRAVPGGSVMLVPADGHIRLTVRTEDMRQLARIVSRCRRLMDLDADPEAVASILGSTDLAPLVKERPGLRVPGAFDGFELAVRAVVGQQISVAGARTILGRIAARAGIPATAETMAGASDTAISQESRLLFPTAERLAEADLSGLGLTNRRISTLKALAEAVAAGEIDLDGAEDPAETTAKLLEMPGIGPWTTSYIALRSLRDPDAWPEGDLVLRRTMAKLGIPAGQAELWRPWRAYAALHLWNASAPVTTSLDSNR